MKTLCTLAAAGLLLGLVVPRSCWAQPGGPAGPISAEEARRQKQILEQLTKALAAETTDAGKLAQFARVMKDERNVNLRRQLLEMASKIPGPDLDAFVTHVLTEDADAGIRSQAATTLGRLGSEKCLAALAQAAAKDRTTQRVVGDVGGESSARRDATFAIAELARRFPKQRDDATAALRALPDADDPNGNENLADARLQALYQITRDGALLKPFHERLRSNDAGERARGVIAFQFLKLQEAPTEIVAALKDTSAEVRSWSALVLGRIGDPKTDAALMAAAGDAKEQTRVRCNAIFALGHMKSAAAADLMEKLLADPTPSVQTNAAIALYRITGKKAKQFPKGYRVD
jgi:HEAT repeat protein